MTLQIAMVLFKGTPTLSSVEVQTVLSANWPDLPVAADCDVQDNTLSFRLGGADVVIGVMPAAIPWTDLEGPCATSYLWPNALTEAKAHNSHAIVTVTGELSPQEISTLLTQVCAAVLASSSLSLGVFWTNAVLVISKGIFNDFATQILPNGPPLTIWVDFRVGWIESGKTSAGFTTGLASLGLMELEAQEANEPPSELRQRFETIAQYLLDHGPVIEDGNTVGNSATEVIRVTYSPSSFGAEGQVMRLSYEET